MDIIYRFEPSQSKDFDKRDTAEQAIKSLEVGNRRYHDFVRLVSEEISSNIPSEPLVVPSSPLELGISSLPGQAPEQTPFAVFLGCSDARASVETIFDHSLNQFFTVRVAGNVLGTECLGSIEYAVRNLAKGLRLVVVLGHSSCGAVGAAVELYFNPDAYVSVVETHSLRAIVDRILVVVRMADRSLHDVCGPDVSRQPGYKAALWEMSVYLNAALTARDIHRELDLDDKHPTNDHQTDNHQIKIVFGVYDLATHLVHRTPGSESAFYPAPCSTEEFNAVSRELAESIRDRGILNPAQV